MPPNQFRAAFRDGRLAIHTALTAVMAWFAVILALRSDTCSASKFFACVATMGSEPAWALVFWVAACLGLVWLLPPLRVMRLGSVPVLATLGYFLTWRHTDEGV